jgi:hypothetical protein
MSDVDDDGYTVGYRKPPREHRFKPGQSGNRAGRKPGARGLKTELNDALNRNVSIKVDGNVVTASALRQSVTTLALRAANGDLKAQSILYPLILQIFGFEDRGADRARLSAQDQGILEQMLEATKHGLIEGDPEPVEEALPEGAGTPPNRPPDNDTLHDDHDDDGGEHD